MRASAQPATAADSAARASRVPVTAAVRAWPSAGPLGALTTPRRRRDDELTIDDVANAPIAEAEAILRRYRCQLAQQLPADHFRRADEIARHCS